MKKILVTGADGFIGSHLCERLTKEGHEVTALSMYNSFGHFGWLDTLKKDVANNIEMVHGDVRDKCQVFELVRNKDYVFHLAALIGIPYSYQAPYSYVDTNILGTLNVLEACRKIGVDKLVHTSTSETYGTAQYVPIDEGHPINAQSPYAATKVAADELARSYFLSHETPVTIVRPFNTYGPRQSLRAVLPTIILQALDNKEEIRLGSLAPTRDFNYVADTVDGFIAAGLPNETAGETFNIASKSEVSIGEALEMILEYTGSSSRIVTESSRLRPECSEVMRLFGDNKKILERSTWRPKYHGLDGFRRGLQETIDWFSVPENRASYGESMRYTV